VFQPTEHGNAQTGCHASIAEPQGILTLKNLARGVAVIGIEFEKPPAPFSVPAALVVQMIGADKFVVVSKV
jgi:hypothetical protein